MKKLFFSLLLLALFTVAKGKPVIQQPAVIHPTALAVLCDTRTYQAVKEAVAAYKNALEQHDGLSVYVVTGDWKSPEEVKTVLSKLASARPAIEGAVLVGQIPVVMVRNAQHLTTALKIDELKYSYERSSVPSDRFYDDFDLTFRYIRQDKEQPMWFYYDLREDSPQFVRSDIYTSRICPDRADAEGDEAVRRVLNRAAAVRTAPVNELDQLLAFSGAGYNSESLVSWTDEQAAFRELFPKAFVRAGNNRMLNYRMEPAMKGRLFSELQRPDLDLAILSHHGEAGLEHLTGTPAAADVSGAAEMIRYAFRTSLRPALKKGRRQQDVISEYERLYGVPSAFFEGFTDSDSLRKADSLIYANTNIVASEVKALRTGARMIVLNACGNSAFHKPGNIASSYLFNDGHALVVHGNTVNVLQDKWTWELMGLLDKGVRAGLWAMQSNTLESQLIGDPAFHFGPAAGGRLAEALLPGVPDEAVMREMLRQSDPVLQAVALKALAGAGVPDIDSLLSANYRSSSSWNVRMQCLALLSRRGNEAYRGILLFALDDGYELIRRKAADWIARDGSDRFIAPLVAAALSRPNDERVMYTIYKALALMNWDKVQEEVGKQLSEASYLYDSKKLAGEWMRKIALDKARASAILSRVKDRNLSPEIRYQQIRNFRNGTWHVYVPDLLAIASDPSEPPLVRQHVVEALGWFSTSWQKEKIMACCKELIANAKTEPTVKGEAVQTLSRLEHYMLP